jgi:hypothetical protein
MENPTKKRVVKKIVKVKKVKASGQKDTVTVIDADNQPDKLTNGDQRNISINSSINSLIADVDSSPVNHQQDIPTSIESSHVKINSVQYNVWTDEEKTKLNECIKNGATVPEISALLGRTESSVRFQLKMAVYNEIEYSEINNKIKNMRDLIDGTKIPKPVQYKTDSIYHNDKFINMLAVYSFLEIIKDERPHYINLYEQVKSECINKLEEIISKN